MNVAIAPTQSSPTAQTAPPAAKAKPVDAVVNALRPSDRYKPLMAGIGGGALRAIVPVLVTQAFLSIGSEGAPASARLATLGSSLGGAAIGTIAGLNADKLSERKGRVIAVGGLVAATAAAVVTSRFTRGMDRGVAGFTITMAALNTGITAALSANGAIKDKAQKQSEIAR
jgi:uncharacterized membrane protein YfcA